MGGSIGTNMDNPYDVKNPYRNANVPDELLTDRGIVFWDSVYVGFVACRGDVSNDATRIADEAVQIQRKKFGVR